jgi:hypothetical protein
MAEKEITFWDARLIFRNLKGEASKFNRKGARNFCVILKDPEVIVQLEEDGWNVKRKPPREEGDDELIYMKVNVNFEGPRPPKIVMITSKNRTELDEDLISMLDVADIAKVDLIVRPYSWEVEGSTGISAYLKTMYITIHEDEVELAYAIEQEESF